MQSEGDGRVAEHANGSAHTWEGGQQREEKVIEPGRIGVVGMRKVVPTVDASSWPCTRCTYSVHPKDSYWLGYRSSSSETPFVVPVCGPCIEGFVSVKG